MIERNASDTMNQCQHEIPCLCDWSISRKEMMYNVEFNYSVKDVLADEAEISIDCRESAIQESPCGSLVVVN